MSRNLISVNECSEIIRKSCGIASCTVIDYDVTNYCDGYPGFLGEYYSLTIKFHESESTREKRFFVKSLPTANVEKREMMQKYGIFEKEVKVFKHLFPKLLKYSGSSKWAPECYTLSRDDLMVLEDLKTTHYQTLPKHIDPTINHIKMALRSLAAYHAANIIYERLELRPNGSTIGDTYRDMLFETSYAPDNPWCMTGIRALKAVALHKTKYGFGSSYQQAIEAEFIGKVCKIFELIEAPESLIPRVCCHRDLWKNNLMYRFDSGHLEDPSHCLLIDFQICRYLPLTLDVIICILLPSRDHSSTDECLKFYYECLANELLPNDVKLEELMSWRDFEGSCKRFALVPLVQQGLFWSLTNLPDGVLTNLLANNESEYIKICQTSRDDIVFENMASDEYYRECMTETVERLIEYLFIDGEN